ncbi:MAG: CRISPR-associated endoribonuclease Cas6 [Candidatus Nitrosocosmicus sp.]|nr:CRISPR-associated endoribonuclease Cas6 [Candidatus Nitrosocosmicus sp.]
MPTGSERYTVSHNYKIMSFIYRMLEKTEFEHLHDTRKLFRYDKKRIPFCFSNVFSRYGFSDTKHKKHLIISSPDRNLILYMHAFLQKLINQNLKFGNLIFNLLDAKVFDCSTRGNKILTLTPIVIRIPKSIYKNYQLDIRHYYDYLYWRKQFPLELFLNQLQRNLKKKYLDYYGKEPKNDLKFTNFILRKQISHKLEIHGSDSSINFNFVGILWFEDTNIQDNMLFRFTVDAGLGERNSLGFGLLII